MKIAKLSGKPEIFHTIQGEGRSAGLPCIFLRLSLCNLHCMWCDTDYTWNWEGTPFRHINDQKDDYKKFKREEQIIEYNSDEVAAAIFSFKCKNLVITGGEPLMQQKELSHLLSLIREDGRIEHIEVETNGTLLPSEEIDLMVNQFNVSPKLSNSANPENLRIKKRALAFFSGSPKANFKFVISSKKDLHEVEELVSRFNISSDKVILMPLGTSVEELNEREKWLADICRNRGYAFSDRMHIRLYGNRRGV